jgi:hypothetical protein
MCCMAAWLTLFICSLGAVFSMHDALQILVAPKVYLIEYAASLTRSAA